MNKNIPDYCPWHVPNDIKDHILINQSAEVRRILPAQRRGLNIRYESSGGDVDPITRLDVCSVSV
jgi:hypothetical protein